MSDAKGEPLLPRWRIPAGEYPAAAELDRLRSMEAVIAHLARQLTILPVGHPRRAGLIGMICGLSAEAAGRARAKALSLSHRGPLAGASRCVEKKD